MKRTLDLDLFAYLCKRVPLSPAEMKTQTAQKLMVLFDAASNGIVEVGGQNRGLRVQQTQKIAGGKPGYAWCMYKNQVVIACVEKVLGIVSPVLANGHCMTVLRDAKKNGYFVPIGEEQPGDMVIWNHSGSDSGHTGVLLLALVPGKAMLTNEGNTTLGPGIVGEGDGCYMRLRDYDPEGNMVLQGFVRPFKT